MKRAFVTGAAKRVGRHIAVHLSRSGYEVIAHYNTSEAEARALKMEAGCSLFQADLSSIRIQDLLSRLEREVGRVDVLINNASAFERSDWQDVSEQLWDTALNTNLKAPFFLIQHFGRQMKSYGKGRIINMVDIAAERAYLPYLPYSIAKAALVSVTRAMARALAPDVQVNGIAPGTILFVESMSEEARRKTVEKIPAGRTATIEEFLATIDFLLSDVEYITGQILTLDGGRSLTW